MNEDDYPFEKYDSSYSLDSTLYLANFYIDFLPRRKKITPYVGIGLGLANFKEQAYENLYFYGTDTNITTDDSRRKTAFALGPNVGFSFSIMKGLEGDVGAYCQVFVIEDRIITCSANLGLRYNF